MDLRDIINSIYPISEKSMDRLLSCSLEQDNNLSIDFSDIDG